MGDVLHWLVEAAEVGVVAWLVLRYLPPKVYSWATTAALLTAKRECEKSEEKADILYARVTRRIADHIQQRRLHGR